MNSVETKSLRKKLEQAKWELEHRAARKAEEGREPRPEDGFDPGDRALATYIKELTFTQSENETELLKMVNGALARMDDGIYGQCLSCGQEISQKRLDAVPWTHYCIACQQKAEENDGELNSAVG